jgi:hypothetical protein
LLKGMIMSPSVQVVGSGPWSGLSPFARPGPTFGIALVLRVEFAHALGSFIASREDGMDARRPEWTIPKRRSGQRPPELRTLVNTCP